MRWNRLASVLTGATAAAHLGLVLSGSIGALLPALTLLLMAAWCLVCAAHLWTSGSARNCLLAAGGGLAMIVLHVAMMSAPTTAGMQMPAGHHHHAMTVSHDPSMMNVAMVVGILTEVVLIAGIGVAVVRRSRAISVVAGRRRFPGFGTCRRAGVRSNM
ncbi:hypothetical protein [Smaragdicoccus niigatensis]|uniref:hypothetical protein n=1 Tax=Smaragdicoccus niigatensis TaxID=359359 RepID=UPI000370F247|nr:hypothetical protein [Smaragdicoccus niigatensis]